MFKFFDESEAKSFKQKLGRWLTLFVIEPAIEHNERQAKTFLSVLDRRRYAESFYEYTEALNIGIGNKLELVDKKQLIKDIALYFDLRIPYLYYKKKGYEEYQVTSAMIADLPFQYKANIKNSDEMARQRTNAYLQRNKDLWTHEASTDRQTKYLHKLIKERKKKLHPEIVNLNKYQASILINYLTSGDKCDENELKKLIIKM